MQFDRIAPHWDSFRDAAHLAPLEAALDALPDEPTRALDLGTGTGAAAVAIARRWPRVEVVGVDVAERMLAEARSTLPDELAERVSFRSADAASLPFADASFDLVTLANMFPFFDELERVVAPGGAVVFSFSSGQTTPIYVPAERLRRGLAARGFTDFAEFEAGRGTGFLARKGKAR
jgi:ubiquinone/menaquinone biosynthesis C-methylase UbiE